MLIGVVGKALMQINPNLLFIFNSILCITTNIIQPLNYDFCFTENHLCSLILIKYGDTK